MNDLTAKMNSMNQAISMLVKRLKQLPVSQTPTEITSLMIHFTIDFLMLSMFGECFHTLEDFHNVDDANESLSEGNNFFKELYIATIEYLRNQTADLLRRHYFWKEDVKRAKVATKYLCDFSFELLQNYRDTHTPEEIEKDSSIMNNLIKR